MTTFFWYLWVTTHIITAQTTFGHVQADLTNQLAFRNLPSAASTHGLLPPFTTLPGDIIKEYTFEFVHRVEQFMNGALEWHHVGMASCARGRMHPEGVFVMDGFPYREEDVHRYVLYKLHIFAYDSTY